MGTVQQWSATTGYRFGAQSLSRVCFCQPSWAPCLPICHVPIGHSHPASLDTAVTSFHVAIPPRQGCCWRISSDQPVIPWCSIWIALMYLSAWSGCSAWAQTQLTGRLSIADGTLPQQDWADKDGCSWNCLHGLDWLFLGSAQYSV